VAAGKIRYYRTPSGRLLFRKKDALVTAERRDMSDERQAM
jgi:hypothetical protein